MMRKGFFSLWIYGWMRLHSWNPRSMLTCILACIHFITLKRTILNSTMFLESFIKGLQYLRQCFWLKDYRDILFVNRHLHKIIAWTRCFAYSLCLIRMIFLNGGALTISLPLWCVSDNSFFHGLKIRHWLVRIIVSKRIGIYI